MQRVEARFVGHKNYLHGGLWQNSISLIILVPLICSQPIFCLRLGLRERSVDLGHIGVVDGVILHPSIPVEGAAAGVEEGALVHLNRKNCANSLNVGISRSLSILAGELGGAEAGILVEEAVDAGPVGDAQLLDDVRGIDITGACQ